MTEMQNGGETASGDTTSTFDSLCDNERQQLAAFRSRLRGCATDDDRSALCTHRRDSFLSQLSGQKLPFATAVLAAAYHDLMLAECPTLLAGHVHDPQWTKFRLETNRARGAQAGCRIRLRTVDGAWTRARILHYQWDRQGRAYLDKLVAAIHAPRRRKDVKNRPLDLLLSWDDAVVKLNQLLLRRHRIWEITGRNGVIAADVNPIQPIDLDCLKEWVAGAPAGAAGSSSYTRPKDKTQLGPLRDTPLQPADLPQGFGFDRFGLLTRRSAVPEVHAGYVSPLSRLVVVLPCTPVRFSGPRFTSLTLTLLLLQGERVSSTTSSTSPSRSSTTTSTFTATAPAAAATAAAEGTT